MLHPQNNTRWPWPPPTPTDIFATHIGQSGRWLSYNVTFTIGSRNPLECYDFRSPDCLACTLSCVIQVSVKSFKGVFDREFQPQTTTCSNVAIWSASAVQVFMFIFRGSLLKVYISISSTMYGLFTKSILSTKIVTLNRPIANSSAQLPGLWLTTLANYD